MKRIRAMSIVVVCILCMVFEEDVSAIKELEGSLYSLSAVLMDGESGRVLYEKDGDIKRPMASTTKIMTCIITLEYGDLNSVAKVSKYAASMPDVQLNIKEGQMFILKDLLYSLMLESHNDSAVAVAECVAGSVDEFAKLMNDKAIELGCTDTYFITPNGLDASEGDGSEIKVHSTTARDLAKIMMYCIKNETFLEITRTSEYSFADKKIDANSKIVNGSNKYKVINRNTLLKNMEGLITGKTGFTADAGYCYVCAYENNGRTYIVALLGCGWPNNKNYKWFDTKKLLKYGSDYYQINKFNNKDLYLPKIKVENGIYGDYYDFGIKGITNSEGIHIQTYVDEGGLELLLQNDETVNAVIDIYEYVQAPIRKGQIVGSVKYMLGNSILKEVNVYASESVDKKDYQWSFGVVFMRFILY